MKECQYCHKRVLGLNCYSDTFVGCMHHVEVHPEYYKPNQSSIDKLMETKFNTPRSRLLEEVMEIVHKDRNASYGNPEDNFKQIANLWNAYIGKRTFVAAFFSPADVAIMNMLIKVARLANNPKHHDSAVDIAGYAACLADIQESMRGSEPPKQDGSASA